MSAAPVRAEVGAQRTFEFLIEVGDRIADGYRLTFAYPDPDSPTGTGGHSSLAPLDPAEPALRAQLAVLPTMVLASAARSRLAVSPMEQAARAVGDHLFRALTGGETLGELARLRRRAQAAGADVRLALRIRPPELAPLPWEFLFDAREDRREFLGRSCMVTRSAGDLRAVPPLPVAGPLRVLAMVAVPSDQAELDVEREREYLEQSLAPMRAGGRLELEWIPATKAALLAATQRRRWHIVHYIGHGDFDAATGAGRLAFAAEAGAGTDSGTGAGTDWVTARQLATILGAHPTLRLVVLNACQSSAGSAEDGQAGLAAALVHAGLAAVVAMQFPITDDAAPVFGREFYGALAAGEPVDRCVRAGRAAITLANDASLEWGTPVLHLRSTDGVLFAMEEDAPGQTVAPPADPEPWRPEPEPEPTPEPAPEPDPHTAEDHAGAIRHVLLQRIGMDLMQAKAKILDQDYTEELVTDLERIVDGYRELHGPEHQDTVSARKLLIRARESLAAARPIRFSFENLLMKPGPAVPVADDPEDQPRTKTTRRGTAERSARPPRSSKAAFVLEMTALELKFDADVLCLSPSAGPTSLFGVGTADGTAHVFFTEAGRQPLRLPNGPDCPVRQIVFSPDEQIVACLLGSGDRPDRLRLWNMTGRPMSENGVSAGHFAFHSADLFVAATGGHDLSLRRYATPFTPYTPYRGLSEVGDIAVSRDGRHVAALGDDEIRIWQALTGELVGTFPAPEARLEMGLQFSADGSALFASHTRHGMVRCDLSTGRSTPCAPPALAGQRPVWALARDRLALGMPSFGTTSAATFWNVASPEIDLGRIPGDVSALVRPVFDAGGASLSVVLPDRRTVANWLVVH